LSYLRHSPRSVAENPSAFIKTMMDPRLTTAEDDVLGVAEDDVLGVAEDDVLGVAEDDLVGDGGEDAMDDVVEVFGFEGFFDIGCDIRTHFKGAAHVSFGRQNNDRCLFRR
jgi:hypothetical protein